MPTNKPKSNGKKATWGCSQYLEDMAMICTTAHRAGLGDLVWLSYDASTKKGYKAKVQHAATLIAVSHSGAKTTERTRGQRPLGAGGALGVRSHAIVY